jgi:iron complex outermembrane recepter protein
LAQQNTCALCQDRFVEPSGDFTVILKRNLLSLALSSALLGLMSGAYAQTEEETAPPVDDAKAAEDEAAEAAGTLDEVVVTGIRSAIESAISTKLEKTSIVEVISAEDIGKLPDTSIAESIARLPGLAAQRVAGRSSTISIRGLAGDFSTTLLNGREQVSSGDNRGVEFDQYPSELLSQVLVYKTPDATLVAQGISGTVDLRTVRPLINQQRVVALNARLEENSLGKLNPESDDKGGRFSFSYIDKFADDTIGVALGFARLDSPGQGSRFEAWGYADLDAQTPRSALGGGRAQAVSTDNVRNGFMGVVEFAPNDFYFGTLDVYYSNFDRDEYDRGLQLGIGFSGAVPVPGTTPIIQNGLVTNASVRNVYGPVVRNDLNTREDSTFAIGFKNEFTFDNNWKGTADFSMSRADREEMILETYSGIPGFSPVVGFTIDPNEGRTQLTFNRDYTDPSSLRLSDPGGWGQAGYIKFPEFKDELRSVLLAGNRSFEDGAFTSLDLGLNYSRREKSRFVAEAFLDLAGTPRPNDIAIPGSLVRGAADLSALGFRGVIAYDPMGALGTVYQPRTNVNQDILNKDWKVEEDVINVFAKLNIDTTVMDIPLRGNFGLQYVRADQQSEGFATPGGNASLAIPFSGGDEYGDVLPSINLSAELVPETLLRFGLAKQQARPRMDQMRANNGYGINLDRLIYSGGGGNPELKPWEATSLDLSFEKYFGTRGYFSIAGFAKDLDVYIYDQTVPFDFSLVDVSLIPGTRRPSSLIGEFTRPENGEGGSLIGFEYAFSVPLELLAEPLTGFGVQGSYSDTRTSISPTGPLTGSAVRQPLPGLSRYVSNLTFYYESEGGFSARVSQRSRSRFLGEVQGFGADRETRFVDSEKIIDFQTGYEFKQGALQGLSVLLQINNLDNEPYRELYRGENELDRPRLWSEYGRTTLLGVNYKF